MYKVYLKKYEDKRIRDGHPWVYANEAQRIESSSGSKNGDLARVYSHDGRFIGQGFINHLSKILVRIMSLNEREIVDREFFARRIREANAMRRMLGYTDNYRVVYGEADNLPALVVDKYADVLVVECLSLGMSRHMTEIVDVLREIFEPRCIYERGDVAVRAKEGLPQRNQVLYGELPDELIIEENGLKLSVDVVHGQKTGYFLDQKENRLAIRRYARDKRVLDCFSNSGGFALNAAAAGAKSVTALDISQFAVDNILLNAKLNSLTVDAVTADVFEKLREYKKEGVTFDMIVLDPPAFTKSASEVKDAYRGYKDINILAMKLLSRGGILVSSSCSHYMTMSLYENMLRDAAKEAGKLVKCLERRAQSPDHPARIGSEETLYLKFYIMQVI